MANTAYEVPGQKVTFKSAGDLSTKKYIAVKLDVNCKIIKCVADERMIGVMQQPAGTDEITAVMLDGVTFATAGAAIAANADISVDVNGNFVTAAAGKVVGVALTPAGGANELFAMKIL